eukprot:SAG11_NODE_11121_length_782_cov_2.121523_1_plen_120_part_10
MLSTAPTRAGSQPGRAGLANLASQAGVSLDGSDCTVSWTRSKNLNRSRAREVGAAPLGRASLMVEGHSVHRVCALHRRKLVGRRFAGPIRPSGCAPPPLRLRPAAPQAAPHRPSGCAPPP